MATQIVYTILGKNLENLEKMGGVDPTKSENFILLKVRPGKTAFAVRWSRRRLSNIVFIPHVHLPFRPLFSPRTNNERPCPSDTFSPVAMRQARSNLLRSLSLRTSLTLRPHPRSGLGAALLDGPALTLSRSPVHAYAFLHALAYARAEGGKERNNINVWPVSARRRADKKSRYETPRETPPGLRIGLKYTQTI